MRKTLVVASREYSAAVKTKSFIISLVLLPLMMSGGIIAQKLGQKLGDTSTKRIAIIDRTPGAALFGPLSEAVARRNAGAVINGKPVAARFELERVVPASLDDRAAVDQQRLELSNRVRKGDLLAFVEMGPDLLKPATQPAPAPIAGASADSDEYDERSAIQYSTNRPTYRDFIMLLEAALPRVVRERRLHEAGISYEQLQPMLEVPHVISRGLAEQRDGAVSYESKQSQIAPFIVPLALIMLMFIVVIVGASPMTANVIEEKQLRIAEVLLGSVRPFELMMGKLLGGVGVALTLATIYFGGAYYVALSQGMATYITTSSILWFIFFTVLGTLMYGSMFVAAGAAVTNIKEAQTMVMPVMLLIVLPMSLLGNLIQDPNGVLATAGSFFPFSAPMIMTARLTIPPGVPVWQAILAAVISIATTLLLVWMAGRVFRVGILMQGQAARFGELARWIVRG